MMTIRLRAALASGNRYKAVELGVLLPGFVIETLDMSSAPEEVGDTFWENALAKARYGRTTADPDAWVLGEDSGLEVHALGNAPGIRSARYAGPDATEAQNMSKLLHAMAGRSDRRARYRCELACITPDDRVLRAGGTLDGVLVTDLRGDGGFGYDPIILPHGETDTVAQLGDAWKASNSHRARAASQLHTQLADSGAGR